MLIIRIFTLFESGPEVICDGLDRPSKDEIRWYKGVWQKYQDDEGGIEFIVHAAFYDARPMAGDHHYLRMQGLIQSTWRFHSVFNIALNLVDFVGPGYCQVWYTGVPQPLIVPIIMDVSRFGKYSGSKYYQNALFSCKLPHKSQVPAYVSLTFHSNQANFHL